MKLTTSISPAPYWTGTGHGSRYVCEFCGDYWLQPEELREHLEEEHPDVEILDPPDDPT